MNKNKKQRLLLEYLASSPDTFARCKSIVKAEYFDPDLRKAVEFIMGYYEAYHSIPSCDQIEAETDVELKPTQLSRDQLGYVADEVEAFCRRRAVETAIFNAPKMIAAGDYAQVEQQIKDAVLISLNRDIGINYFQNPEERIQRMLNAAVRTSTGYPDLDGEIAGGLARKELLMLSANSGGGKSITLANLGANLLSQPKYPGSKDRMCVLYLSLELSEELISQRFDTMMTGIPSVIWNQRTTEITQTIRELAAQYGNLFVKRMPVGTNASAIRAYLKEFELTNGYLPDVLIVDYLDLMGTNERVSAENVFEKDKRATEQLRDILHDFDMIGLTASQQNRSAIDAQELNHSHIAGGISKINTVDWYISIIMTPVMKAAGEIRFLLLKTRNSDGVGKSVDLIWDNKYLRIRPQPPKDNSIKLPASTQPNPNPKSQTKQSWLDMFPPDSDS